MITRVWIVVLVCMLLNMTGCSSPTDVDEPVQGVTIQGIDVSHHNIDEYAPIDWGQVLNAGYIFAFVKATDGYKSCWTDPTFTRNIETGHAAGMLMGAYHYARPDLNPDARVEARCFLNAVEEYLTTGYLRPVLDIETGASLGKEFLSNWIRLWIETVQQETGVEAMLYTYSSFTSNFDASLTRYDFWLAHYTGDPTVDPNPGLWETWDFWQYTDKGSVPGVSDPSIDLDLFNGDIARLQREFVIH